MSLTEREQFKEALDAALTEGTPWVAFDEQPEKELHIDDLHFFASASAAEKFCDEANGEWDFVEQMFNFKNFHYMSIAGLRADLDLRLDKQVNIEAIVHDLAAQNLYLLPGKRTDDLESDLVAGQYHPVCYQRQIDPLMAIADYTVVSHKHTGGQVYEIGHAVVIMKTFDTYKDAQTFLDSAVFYSELSDKGLDYVLVGRFHNRQLEVDMEGHALPHTGLTLLTAVHNHEHGYDYHEVQSLFQPATVTQYFFAGLHDGRLALFNDKLEPATIGQPHQPFYPAYYKHDYLTTKNFSNMNEQSFDYVKTQLFYLGFGEEIAKPLREKMEKNLAEFELTHVRKFGQDETHSVLHFSKGDQMDKDMTFFNRAEVTLKQPGKEDLMQNFYYGKDYNYTLQERYNMMDGRAVYREQPKVAPKEENGETRMKPTGETYFAWRALDFKNADKYGNFFPKNMFWNHQKEIGKYPIKGIEENYDKQRLIAKLEKGNKVDVILLRDGQEMPAKMVANPKMGRLDFYDSNGQILIVRKVEKQAVEQTQQKELTPQEVQKAAIARAAEQKQSEGATEQKQEQRRRQGVRV
ncbi:hypothetical protein LX99_04266 [Mucilaginibacter oryzae]|uniref:DUF3945 domain-containing protein n=1 Tax=Mucilaginibacter oryzae TaxID=468058 RepID=A0A316H221_9SPHI|nr:hypothetical protein [Mucilaginibacter oryzae]PWK72936.1 hypothetical protein LX99_04266 [Mucilaginibacter oryzae]